MKREEFKFLEFRQQTHLNFSMENTTVPGICCLSTETLREKTIVSDCLGFTQ
jgi:hypothetical protein